MSITDTIFQSPNYYGYDVVTLFNGNLIANIFVLICWSCYRFLEPVESAVLLKFSINKRFKPWGHYFGIEREILSFNK